MAVRPHGNSEKCTKLLLVGTLGSSMGGCSFDAGEGRKMPREKASKDAHADENHRDVSTKVWRSEARIVHRNRAKDMYTSPL